MIKTYNLIPQEADSIKDLEELGHEIEEVHNLRRQGVYECKKCGWRFYKSPYGFKNCLAYEKIFQIVKNQK